MSAPLVLSAPVASLSGIGVSPLAQSSHNDADVDMDAQQFQLNPARSADSSPRSAATSAASVPNYVRWQASLENLLSDGDGVLLFKSFLEGESHAHLLDFYFATDGFPRLFAKKDTASLRQLAKQIYAAFLRGDQSVRLRNETRAALAERLRDEQPARDLFDAAKRETIEFLRAAHRSFLLSEVFLSFVRESAINGSQKDADSDSCCSATSASTGASQSQNGSVRASTYLPMLPENVDELLANAARENPIEELHERQLQQLQSQLDEVDLDGDASAEARRCNCSHQSQGSTNAGGSCNTTVDGSQPSVTQSANQLITMPALSSEQARDTASVAQSQTQPQSQLVLLNTAAVPNASSATASASASASSAAALKLNKENLRKTQLSRAAELSSAIYGSTHPAYVTANPNTAFANRKPSNPYYTSYTTVSTQDSELQSQSSDALNDDGSSMLGESAAAEQHNHKRHKVQQQLQHYLRRGILPHRDNLQVLHVVPAQVDAAERELATKHPEVFAPRLAARLQTVLDEQVRAERMSSIMNDPNSPANLTANLQKDDAAFAAAANPGDRRARPLDPSAAVASSGARPQNSDAFSRLASLTNRLAVDLEHQDAQAILEAHCSRVWDKSNELTPIRAASPPATGYARSGSNRQSSASSSRALPPAAARPMHAAFPQAAYTFQQPPSSLSASAYEARDDRYYERYQPNLYSTSASGPYNVSSYPAGYYHTTTSKSDTGCSDLSDAVALNSATGVHDGPLRPLSESASTGSVVATSNITCASGSASSGIVSDFSLATTASGADRSHRRSNQPQSSTGTGASSRRQPVGAYYSNTAGALQQFVAQQTLNGRLDMPRQPFMSNPLMPPVPQPNTDTQIAEAARRLANVNRSDMREDRSRSSSTSRAAHLHALARMNAADQHQQSGTGTPLSLASMQSQPSRPLPCGVNVTQPMSSHLQALLLGGSQPQSSASPSECTQVIYYLPNEKVPYRSTLPFRNVTLAQFRATVIVKRDSLRFFFKKTCDDVETGVVFEEVALDDAVLPLFEGKIVARLERYE